jgi:hypothetical protein
MRTTIRLSPVVILLAAFLAAPFALRQPTHSVAGGLSLAGPSPGIYAFAETCRPGLTAMVSIGTQMSRRMAARVEGSISRFSMRHYSHFVAITAFSRDSCSGICPSTVRMHKSASLP